MSTQTTSSFKGLNTVSDPLRLKLGWLSKADNIDITNTGAIRQRPGYTAVIAGAVRTAFATLDGSRMYLVKDGELCRVLPDMSVVSLVSMSSPALMYWAEADERVYFNNGVDAGIILEDDSVIPWRWDVPGAPTLSPEAGELPRGTYQVCCTFILPDGRETGAGEAATIEIGAHRSIMMDDVPQSPGCRTAVYVAPANSSVFQFAGFSGPTFAWRDGPDALGADLLTALLNPMPRTDVIQLWKGSAFAAEYIPETNQTAVWMSKPLAYHLFDLSAGFFMVPGQVLAMAPTEEALVISTDAAMYAYTHSGIKILAPYGVVPGHPWARDADTGDVFLWTSRGVCKAAPFENLTQEYLSVPPGRQAAACIMLRDGDKKFVASLVQGGTAFNHLKQGTS